MALTAKQLAARKKYLGGSFEPFRIQLRDLSDKDLIMLSSMTLLERYRRYGVCRKCAFERGFFIAGHFDTVRKESGCPHGTETD